MKSRQSTKNEMRFPLLCILLFCLSWQDIRAQFDLMPPVQESGYGLVRTNLTFAYDHTFGAVPDNISGQVSYQLVKKPFLTFSANARFNTIWANFESSQLSQNLDPWDIGMNGNHLYGSVGFTATGFLPLFGHPLALFAVGNAEWSSHCFGRISGLFAGIYMFKLTKNTQIGAGPLFMINTASKIPVFPVFVLRHKFSDKLALNLYGGLFGLEFKPWANDKFVFGADIDVRSFYFKPDVEGWPDKCRFTMTLARPYLKYERRIMRNFYGNIQTGIAIKMSGRVTSATKSHRYLDFNENPAFFLKATLSYSL